MTKIGIYVRISDNDDGRSDGVSRQEWGCRQLAAIRDWQVAKVYSDDNYSAYQLGVIRPDFEQLVEDLSTGVIQGVVVPHLDRLARRLRDYVRISDLYETMPHLVFASVNGGIDLSDPMMRAIGAFFVGIANVESRNTSRRVADYLWHQAKAGNVQSNYPAFGWNKDGTLNAKAELLRLAATRIILGFSAESVVQGWRNDGILTERGK